jgi:MFS family permease
MGLSAYGAHAEGTKNVHVDISGLSLQETILTRQFWMLGIVFLFFGFLVSTAMVHIVPHATDIGISAGNAAMLLPIIGGVTVGSKIGLGSASDKIGNRWVLLIIAILMLVSFSTVTVSIRPWIPYVFAFVFGVAYGGFTAVQSPITAEYFGMKTHATIFGLLLFAVNVGNATGSVVSGLIFDERGSYYWAFMLCSVLAIVALVLSITMKSTHSASERR